MRRGLLAGAALFVSLLGASCSEPAASPEDARQATIVGTVVDAATGDGVAGADVEAPGERRARTDAAGRFEITAIPVRTAGDLRAHHADGRVASVPLRPLAPGRIEVVLHLKRP